MNLRTLNVYLTFSFTILVTLDILLTNNALKMGIFSEVGPLGFGIIQIMFSYLGCFIAFLGYYLEPKHRIILTLILVFAIFYRIYIMVHNFWLLTQI